MRTILSAVLFVLSGISSAQCVFVKYDNTEVVVVQSVSVGTSRLNFVLTRTPAAIHAKLSMPMDSADVVLSGGRTLTLRKQEAEGFPITIKQVDELAMWNLESLVVYAYGQTTTLPVTDRDSRAGVQQQAACVRDANLGALKLPSVPTQIADDASAGLYLQQASNSYNLSLAVVIATVLGVVLIDTQSENSNTTRTVISIAGSGLGLGIWLNGNSKLKKAGSVLKTKGL